MNEILEYIKDVLEGRDDLLPYAQWFRENDAALQQLCNRGTYMRLKAQPLREFRKILAEKGVSYEETGRAYLPSGPGDFSWVRPEWLTKRVFPYRSSPSSFLNVTDASIDEFLHMIHIKRDGDELWHFASGGLTWEKKLGVAGIALVRDRRVVYAIVTMRN